MYSTMMRYKMVPNDGHSCVCWPSCCLGMNDVYNGKQYIDKGNARPFPFQVNAIVENVIVEEETVKETLVNAIVENVIVEEETVKERTSSLSLVKAMMSAKVSKNNDYL